MNKKSFAKYLVLLAAFGFAESIVMAESWTLTGKVTERASLAPVSEAKVSFMYEDGGEISVTTDIKGDYIIKPEIKKAGTLVVRANNFVEFKEHFNARDNSREFYRFDLKLAHNYYTINGKITDFVTRNPIAGAEVTFIYDYGEGKTEPVKTDEIGRYSIKPLIGKNGSLQVRYENYVDFKDKINARDSDSVNNNFNYEIRPTQEVWTLSGKVLENRTLYAIPNAQVVFTYDDNKLQPASTTSDALGNFELKPLINKAGNLSINSEHFKTLNDNFAKRESGRDTYYNVYRLSHDYWTLSGTLVDYKTNDPAPGVNVQFIYDKTAEKSEAVKTDEKGFYTLKIDADKSGTLEFSGENWVTRKENIGGRGSDSFENWNYDIHKVDETFTIKGRISERSTTNYIEGAKVSFVYDKGGEISTTTDKLGNYILYPLINNAGKITISKDSYLTFNGDSISRDNTRIVENWDYTLPHNYWTLTGKISDYKTGDGVKDATVTFFYEDGSKIEAKTNEAGFYKITPENDKRGIISISCPGWITRKEGDTARGTDAFENWNYEISRENETYTLIGRVLNSKDNTPVANATVEYVSKNGVKSTATTNENGDYIVNPILNQEGTITVTCDDFENGNNSIGAKDNSRTREQIDFKLTEKKKVEKTEETK